MTGSLRGAARRLRCHVRRARRRVTRERLRWTVRLRATVIVVFLALAACARDVLPSLGPALLAAGAGIAMNALAARRVRRWERIPSMLAWTAVGDVVLITYVVVTTGGTASPFLFLYV